MDYRSLSLIVTVLLLMTLSFAVFQTGRVSSLEAGFETYRAELKKTDVMVTRELAALRQLSAERDAEFESLKQECREDSQLVIFTGS